MNKVNELIIYIKTHNQGHVSSPCVHKATCQEASHARACMHGLRPGHRDKGQGLDTMGHACMAKGLVTRDTYHLSYEQMYICLSVRAWGPVRRGHHVTRPACQCPRTVGRGKGHVARGKPLGRGHPISHATGPAWPRDRARVHPCALLAWPCIWPCAWPC